MTNDDAIIRIPREAYEALEVLAFDDRRSRTQQVAWLIEQETRRREEASA